MLALMGDNYIADYIAYKIDEQRGKNRLLRYITDGLYAISNRRMLKARYEFPIDRLPGYDWEKSDKQIRAKMMRIFKGGESD